MRKLLLLTVSIILQFPLTLHAQSVTWAHNFGGTDNDGGTHIAVDANGNTYVTGYYSGSATFGTTTVSSLGGKDAFLAKYNPAGNFLWVASIGGTGNDEGAAICVDANGNIFVSGIFASPSISTIAGTLANSGGDDIFFLKYNSGGIVTSAAKAGGPGYEKCLSICTDATGNLYATGYLAGMQGCTFGTTTLTGTGVSSMFIAKYNASLSALWAQKAGGLGASGNVRGTGIAVDFSGTPFVTGPFLWGADFVIQQFTAIGNTDMFLAKYNSTNGTLSAAYQYYGSSAASRINPASIKMDASGFCNIAGYFTGNAILGSTTINTNGLDDIFITKINAVGNVQWAVSAGGAGDDRATGLALDASGGYYLSGYLDGSFNFGSIPASGNAGSPDVFVAKYNATVTAWSWVITGGSSIGYEYAYDIATDGTSKIMISGQADAAFNLGGQAVNNSGFSDGFVAGINAVTGIENLNSDISFTIFPNPADGIIHIRNSSHEPFSSLELMSITGTVVYSIGIESSSGHAFDLDLTLLPIENGIYFIQLSDGEKMCRQKLILVR